MSKFLHTTKKLIPKKLFSSLQPVYHFLMSWLSSVIYRQPSNKLIVIGITGTTGKTTSTYLIAKCLEGLGYKVGFTSTAMFNDGRREWLNDKKMTMPGRFFSQAILNKMVKHGCQYAIVETTSEGIRQFRHRFINYDILVFTGLYPEHIESHGSFENYRDEKAKLFAYLKTCKTKYADDRKKVDKTLTSLKKLELNRVKKVIVANLDDEYSEYFTKFWAEQKIGYTQTGCTGFKDLEVINYGEIAAGANGISFKIEQHRFDLKILGQFNAANAMNAYGVAVSQGFDFDKIKASLEQVNGAPGRLEQIDEGQKFKVIVDYAFEPNAVTKLFETIANIPHQKIIQVLGSAGGGRDSSRRPILGRIAGERADYVIVTDEDPYDENPEIIMDQIVVGVEKAGKVIDQNLYKIKDRREAINKALSLAEPGDMVLITGKGNEQGICVADGQILPWDDRVVVREELSRKSQVRQ